MLSRWQVTKINVAKLFVLAALVPPATVGIAQRAGLIAPGSEVAVVGTVGALGSIGAVAGAIAFGFAADRCRATPQRRWGITAFATVVALVGFCTLVTAEGVWILGLGWLLAEGGASGAMAILRALLTHVDARTRRFRPPAIRSGIVARLEGREPDVVAGLTSTHPPAVNLDALDMPAGLINAWHVAPSLAYTKSPGPRLASQRCRDSGQWCARGELNPHALSGTRT
ncbi:hypothetical protein GCM10011490_19320 [Pseudoclavibacter endophyticus]|nr:hypothetical protein GCM10011490_19320 [Pseudoclavibacter endophyticus]